MTWLRSMYRTMTGGRLSHVVVWFVVGLVVVSLWVGWILHPVGTGHNVVPAERASVFYIWNIWWVYQALVVQGESPYFTTYNGYPGGVSLRYHNLVLPLGVFSIPLRALGISLTRIYLFWLGFLPLLGYAGMYALLRRLRAPPAGAAAGGAFFVMNPFMRLSLGAPDVYAFVLVPWIVLTVLQLRSRPAYWVLLPSGLGAILLLAYPYFGAGILLLWILGFGLFRRFDLDPWRYLSLGPLVLLLSSFHWLPQVLGDPPPIPVPKGNYFYLDALFLPSSELWWVSWLGPWMEPLRYTATDPMIRHFPTMYLGVTALVLAGWAGIRRRGYAAGWCLLTGGVFLAVALGKGLVVGGQTVFLEGYTPYTLAVGILEPLRAMRVVRRFVLFDLFLLAVGLSLVGAWRTRWKYLLFGLLIAEIVCLPVDQIKELPPADELQKVREHVEAPALVPIPMTTHYGSEASYGQVIHHKKFPLLAISHIPAHLERYLESHPVLRAVYRQEPPPDRGWRTLLDQGYGGVILHRQPFVHNRSRYYAKASTPTWSRFVDMWREALRSRFGQPSVENDFFELYRLDDAGRRTAGGQ